MRSTRRFIATAWLAAAAACPAPAQTLGPEFRANTFTSGPQDVPRVAALAGGGFLVVWYSDFLDGDGYGIFGQRFSSTGSPAGGEFRVNTFTTGNQRNPAAASLSNGGFVVVWASRGQDGDGLGVFGRRFDSSGQPAGAEFMANSATTGDQDLPAVGALANGGFVVVWQGGPDGGGTGVSGQRFDAGAVRLGTEFVVNAWTTGDQTRPAIASGPAGDFVVVWESAGQDGSGYGIFGRRFASSGVPASMDFPVNTFTTNDQRDPSVSVGPTGDFVVAWDTYGQDGYGRGVAARRFSSGGAALGGEFQVNTYTTSFQYQPAVSVGPGGDFVVAWVGDRLDGDIQGIVGRRFSSLGDPTGADFVLNAYSTSNQCDPSLAWVGGEFVAVWASFGQDGSNYGVFGRRSCQSPLVTAPAPVTAVQTICQ